MGFFDKVFSFFGFGKREVNVLVVGLNNSGKSTVLNHFKADEQKSVDIVPTVGFSVERFSSKFQINYYALMYAHY
jgi:ADP-ribosylation factor-like protein 6